MSRVHLLLLLSLLFSSIVSTTSVTFKCTTLKTCQSMIGYVSPNFTNPSFLKDRFGVDSLSSLLKFNNWSTSDTNRSIPANSAVRIPFTCTCTKWPGLGVSEGTPVYTVAKDNTLSYIAETIFGGFVTYQEIATVNGISDANKIDIGQHLWIPLPCSCDAVDGATVIHLAHVVASGTSLSQIAAEFETTEAVLSNLNSETLRDAKYLNAGQILDVPIKGDGISLVLAKVDDKSRSAMLRRGAIAGICITILACICVFMICLVRKLSSDNFIFFRKKKTNDVRKVEEFLENCDVLVLKRYRYLELKKITNSFTNNLGQGGYGSVFKGKLNDGRLVAVKVLNNSKGNNGEEFINEVASIGRTCHLNIVALLGFCSEGSKRALVYEYMSKGSLDKIIFLADNLGTSYVLDIQKLFQIAVGIARGLEYLHRGCNTRIVHFDIKPHNILLDDGLCPKISDFGLAKLCPQQKSTVSMLDARGTMGYTAPELFCRSIGGVSYKSDVYSYGMMVLEMVGGRKNIDAEVENISQIYFPHWIYKHIELRESLEMLEFTTKEEEEIARKMILVALWCIQTVPKNRPSMNEVVGMLEGSLGSLQMPPKPYLSSP